ncbi:MAG: hypothetical protein MZU84_05925 [Sphingobacterium sp.]|nr:hypothetical protein [Sphingobacterium sp.]
MDLPVRQGREEKEPLARGHAGVSRAGRAGRSRRPRTRQTANTVWSTSRPGSMIGGAAVGGIVRPGAAAAFWPRRRNKRFTASK